MSPGVVVIGLGNVYRRDDGVGIAAAAALSRCALPGVRVVTEISDSADLLDAWDGAGLAVVIDGAVTGRSAPGTVCRCGPDQLALGPARMSSHSFDLAHTLALGRALSRMPDALVLLAVEIADIGQGEGLSPAVAAVVPTVVEMAADEINRNTCHGDR